MKEVWRNLDGQSKNKEFVELRSDFELSRRKVSQKVTLTTNDLYALFHKPDLLSHTVVFADHTPTFLKA